MKTFKKAWDYVWNKCFSDETNLIYDFPIKNVAPQDVFSLPTPDEIAVGYPNPCGWNTGMEDSMINAGVMMAAVLRLYAQTGDMRLQKYAQKLCDGILNCAAVSDSPGFLARSISPYDKKSFYIDSSRDQYTHAIYALDAYYHSELSGDDEKDRIAKVLVSFAERGVRNAVAENDYNLLRADGEKGVVSKMWEVAPHEWLRLPMFFVAAYNVTGDEKWLRLYRERRDKAIEESFKTNSVWHYCITYQACVSAAFLMKYETEDIYNKLYGKLLVQFAELAGDFLIMAEKEIRTGNISFSLPATPWRELELPKENAVIGIYEYKVPILKKTFEKELWLLSDAVAAYSVQAICKDRPICNEQSNAFKYIVDAVDYNRHFSRVIPSAVDALTMYFQRSQTPFPSISF